MKFTDLFVKRPVLAVVVSLVILIAGLQSVRALNVRWTVIVLIPCALDDSM